LDDSDTALSYACLLCQNGKSLEAQVIFSDLLKKDKENGKDKSKFETVTMLMSIAYSMTATANNKDHLSAEKYKAISNIATLRKAG